MKKGSFGQYLAVFLVVIGILYVIGTISEASEPKCIKAGCDNKQATGSSYCSLHKPYTGSSSYKSSSKSSSSSYSSGKSSSSSYSGTSSNKKSGTTGSSSSSQSSVSSTYKSNSSGKKSSSYHSYDDGYDSIYDDGDYDYDRYNSDSDYADGVDDAMDELGDDWQVFWSLAVVVYRMIADYVLIRKLRG